MVLQIATRQQSHCKRILCFISIKLQYRRLLEKTKQTPPTWSGRNSQSHGKIGTGGISGFDTSSQSHLQKMKKPHFHGAYLHISPNNYCWVFLF